MKFEEVLACLENAEKLELFINKLRKAGPNSKPFLNVQNAMVELKMNKPPAGIHEKTILQHMFKFTDSEECFQSFRLVSKSWKDAVETIRFNRMLKPNFFNQFRRPDIHEFLDLPTQTYLEKYLKAFRKVNFPMRLLCDIPECDVFSTLILQNMKKLNCIHLDGGMETIPQIFEPFILEILENSRHTLQYAVISRFAIPNVLFPKLKVLQLDIGMDITLPEFKLHFPQVLENAERLENIEIAVLEPNHVPILEFVGKKYADHCVSADVRDVDLIENLLDYVPVKIVTHVENIQNALQNLKFVSEVRYLHLKLYREEGWENYQDIFDQCCNLEAIELAVYISGAGRFITYTKDTPRDFFHTQIWQERFSYFEKRGIQIFGYNEIAGNKGLRKKLAKEAGVPWKFHFY